MLLQDTHKKLTIMPFIYWKILGIFARITPLLPQRTGCCTHSTALSGKLKWQKNIQSISRLLRERPHPGLQNEPPLDSLDPQSPNPFMASPSPDPIQRLAIKGFRDWGSRLSSGGSFWSPGWGPSHSSLEIDWIFFCHFNFPESAVFYQRFIFRDEESKLVANL